MRREKENEQSVTVMFTERSEGEAQMEADSSVARGGQEVSGGGGRGDGRKHSTLSVSVS